MAALRAAETPEAREARLQKARGYHARRNSQMSDEERKKADGKPEHPTHYSSCYGKISRNISTIDVLGLQPGPGTTTKLFNCVLYNVSHINNPMIVHTRVVIIRIHLTSKILIGQCDWL